MLLKYPSTEPIYCYSTLTVSGHEGV